MTDKDIKDYCKNCSVEPPAMRIKCTECKYNPDKEQIIIDGGRKSGITILQMQLARKEQEINNVHEYYKELRSNATELANKYVQLRRQLKEKEQECEALESQLDFEVQQKECLEQECEELKDYARRQENQRETYYKEFLKKDKALKKIEEFCNLRKLNPVYALVTIKILDIINKIKE